MLSLPSYQFEYTMIFSEDPALDIPPLPTLDRSKASADEIAAADKIIEDRQAKLRVARQTGNWPLKPNQRPTVFRMRQVGGSAVRWWMGESQRERLTAIEDLELMFRLALVGIDNLEGVDLKHDEGKFRMVSTASMDAIYRVPLGFELVMELGEYAARRATRGVDPL